jgi:hypothetical protein
MKTKRWSVLLTAATALALGAAATPASAQAYTAKVKLPYDVQWGRAVLTAGEYRLVLNSIGQPMHVLDEGGGTRAIVYGSAERPRPGVPTQLLVTNDRGVRTVRALNCRPWGVDFVYKPFTRAERQLLASGEQVERLPVRLASR